MIDKIKQISRINIYGYIIAFIGAFMLIPNYYESAIYPLSQTKEMWLSIDPSWSVALNYFKLKNLTWGSEAAFTYGPLALFCTRVGWGENKITFLIYDLFIFINFFLVFFISYKKSFNKIITSFIIVTFCLISPLWFGSSNALILMAFLVFWIRLSVDNPKPIYFIFQVAIITLVFYIKFNTGLIAFPLFYTGIIYNLISKKGKTLFLIAFAVLPLILVYLLSLLLNVLLIPYMLSGIEMVKGFNDVMFSSNTIKNSASYSHWILLLLTIVFLYSIKVHDYKKWLKNSVVLFLAGVSIFVLYKQSFVRADGGHVLDFFIYISLLLLCNYDFHIHKSKWFIKSLIIIIILLPIKFLSIDNNKVIEVVSKFPKSNYINEFNSFTSTSGMKLFPNEYKLPNSILDKVGNSTIDVFPWNILMLLQNKLNYAPRPVMQSYTAYTPYLENMNFEHYNSKNAPEFVIYEVASIDNRYAFFDESKVSLALSRNYFVAETFQFDGREVQLLQKKKDFKPIKFEKINEYAMLFDSALIPKKDVFYQIEVYNTLLGKMVSTITHNPEVKLIIKSTDGYKREFRTSKLLLESGIFGDFYISDTKSVNSLFTKNSNDIKVQYYSITPIDESYFKEKIRVIEYKITQ